MPNPASLDELISRKAAEFADRISAAARAADKEEEIRIEAERQLAFIEREAGVRLEGRHEFTVASGRVDSVYDRVIIEYKNPSSPGARIGPKADSPGSRKVVEQIKKRFYDMREQFGRPLNTLLGVGLDGKHFIFVRFRDEKWQVQEPVEVNRHSAERFLWALFNLGRKGKPFSPEHLARDFGSDAKLAHEGIRALYEAISSTDHPKAQTFFSQWKILFGEVCGYDVDDPSERVKKLAEFYGVEHRRGVKPAELLFAVHSYYALFMKLLASEVVAFFHKLPTPLRKMTQATTGNKLRREMEDLEHGSIFRHLNITNFLEGDLFAWYTFVWGEPVEQLVRAMVARLDEYNPGTLSEDPAGSRDLLKKLYQQLFPKSVRHDLGEYYTPDWLAEHVLNELGYKGDPDERLLDPSCGSGTFLVMAINRIRRWYEENRERLPFDEGELCRKILSNVIGFDLNPLAVMAARTNYLIAIRDLIPGGIDRVEIPVYLCDSIMTPSDYGGLFASELGKTKELRTAVGVFHIPTEIATNGEDVARYAEQLERCIREGCTPEEFVEFCRDEGLQTTEDRLHVDLYKTLVQLSRANKNGVWARIIKNSFAPLFIGRVDYIAGNPPWINWENLPQAYREQTARTWDRYGLRANSGRKAAIGKSKHEMAALFLYVTADNYLAEKGKLGFVITQSVFKNQGAGGFRTFQFDGTYLAPLGVTDLVECTVFEGAVNRTATVVVEKRAAKFTYPVPYTGWSPLDGRDIPEDATLEEAKAMVATVDMRALPSDPLWSGSPWLTCPTPITAALTKVIGRAYYRAYEGVNSGGLVGAYWVRKQQEVSDDLWLIENLADAGKIKAPRVTHRVERELLYPYIRGRDVKRWQVQESCLYLLTHDPESRKCIGEAEMRRHYRHAYEYLGHFKQLLLARKTAPIRQQMKAGPFYPILGIGPHTVARWKVVFKDLTELFQCSVVGPNDSSISGKPLIPDYTLRLIPAESEAEAYYIAGLLNSSPCLAALYYSSAGVQTQRYHAGDAEKIAIGQYAGSPEQKAIATLSMRCHASAREGDISGLRELESLLDQKAAEYWDISAEQLQAVQEALAPIKEATDPYRGDAVEDEES